MRKLLLVTLLTGFCFTGFSQTFPELKGADGAILMTNAEFKSVFGSKVIFETPDFQMQSFEVSQLHSDVLKALKIDVQKLNAKQAQIDAANAAYREQMAAAAQAQLQNQKTFLDAKAIQDKEAAKQAEADRRQKLAEDHDQQIIDNDKLRAQADMKEANAAIIEAQRP